MLRHGQRYAAIVLLPLLTVLAGCGSSGSSAAPQASTAQQLTPGLPAPAPQVFTPGGVHTYGRNLLPVLSDSVPVFDAAARAAARSYGQCVLFEKRITLLQSEADGVPHPDPWSSPVGRMHHRLLGDFHLILGAMEGCQTAYGNGDVESAAQEVAYMATAALDLHRFTLRARQFANQTARKYRSLH